MPDNARRAEIIRFWRTVEIFSPPKVDPVSPQRRIFRVGPGQPLPWEPEHHLARKQLPRHKAWRHVVYVGIYPMRSVFEVLSSAFPPDPDSHEERPPGESALAAFVVSGEGRPLIGSEVLSSCAWATGRVLHPGPGTPGWLSGFDTARSAFSEAFEDLVAAADNDGRAQHLRTQGFEVGRRIAADDVHQCLDLAAECAATSSALPFTDIRVQSLLVDKRNQHKSDGHDFLNSFIVDDLAEVGERAESGELGHALREYLRPDSELPKGERIDLREDLGTSLEATAPQRIPLGRWPSKPEHPLALNQQLAVNTTLRMGESGVLGVNGPPGTGKTTMLRDVIAEQVVERARRLSELDRPADAFTGVKHGWSTGERKRVVHEWQPHLTGFEMVVTSSNNGAVENVTNEIPSAEAIDASWRAAAEELDYFPHIASALLNGDDSAEAASGWALVAARLGNKSNRSSFVSTFWYLEPKDPQPENKNLDEDELSEQERAQLGLWRYLKRCERSVPTRTWEQAVTDFERAHERAKTAQSERQRAHDALGRRERLGANERQARQKRSAAETEADEARRSADSGEKTAQHSKDERDRLVQQRVEHRQFRPGFWEVVLSLGKALRTWRDRDQELAERIAEAEQEWNDSRTTLNYLRDQADHAEEALRKATAELQLCVDELTAINTDVARWQQVLGRQFPDDQWWQDRSRRELAALWTDPEWNTARTELFVEALRLHKAFLENAPTEMRQSLHAATDVVRGEAPKDLPEQTALEAWRALFFVVPVVSTTFASFARLFSHLGEEALGWLLVDEAGQSTPQNPVGALWRSKRALLVGDPRQLEPITPLPFRAEQSIRGDHGVDEQWLPSRTSAQALADRLTTLGTSLPGDEGPIWVGAPLTAHRRCDQPMFGIANDIAYDGLMIHATPASAGEEFEKQNPSLPRSKWIDVPSESSQGHWIPEEGRQLARILGVLHGMAFDMSEVLVIAPFRDISREVAKYSDDYPGLTAGTVHTSQGKQADVVILVLGGNPQKPGARNWAASKPNLLNVAASRAKRRLYVIGNHQNWNRLRHFDVLAARLPHDRPR